MSSAEIYIVTILEGATLYRRVYAYLESDYEVYALYGEGLADGMGESSLLLTVI